MDLSAPLDAAVGDDKEAYRLVGSLASLILDADTLVCLRRRRCLPGEEPGDGYRREATEHRREAELYVGLVYRIFRGLAALGARIAGDSELEAETLVHVRRAKLLLACMGGSRA